MPSTKKLAVDDLLSLERYSRERNDFRARVMAHKRNRQLTVGPNTMWLFEDRLTVQYQVQEMLRTERIFEAEGIAEELGAYNPLIPDGTNWKVTFLIEYPDPRCAGFSSRSSAASRIAAGSRWRGSTACSPSRMRIWIERTRRRRRRCTSFASNSPLPCLRNSRVAPRCPSASTTPSTSTRSHPCPKTRGRRSLQIWAERLHTLARRVLLFLFPLDRRVDEVGHADRGRNQAEDGAFPSACHADAEEQQDADQHQHDAAAKRLGRRGRRRTIAGTDEVRRQGRELD